MRRWRVWPLLMAVLAMGVCGWAQSKGAAPPGMEDDVTQGALRTTSAGAVVECPLKHTDVKASITGFLARVTVTQTFANPSDKKIEAVYVFPLPHTAAIDGMTMDLGDHRVIGVIKRREEARQMYEMALARGTTASLLEQERPNIFTQSVANIKPHAQVKIEISYIDVLKYDMGTYEFHFPMVVGPRYKPAAIGGATPVIKTGQRPGHDVSLAVQLDAGVPVHDLKVENHQAEVKQADSTHATVTLSPQDAIPNKDFVLRYSVIGEKPQMALLAHAKDSYGYFMLMMQPKIDDTVAKAPPREFVFLVDVSGSMNGRPTAKVKEVLTAFFKYCKPEDTIQVVTFASTTAQAFDHPVSVTPENSAAALNSIHPIRGAGGTEMAKAVTAVLNAPIDPERKRIVLLITDGYIGNESDVIQTVAKRDTSAVKFWTLGIGMAPNRFLLDGVAKQGGGMSEVIGLNTDPNDTIKKIVERMHFPQVADINIDWGTLPVAEIFPRNVPELWAGRPVILFGRYDMGGQGTLTLTGKADGQPVRFSLDVNLPIGLTNANDVLGKVWARQKIDDLSAQCYYANDPTVAEEITRVALDYGLMSQYTSLVAVDEQDAGDEQPTPAPRVYVPVPLPDGIGFTDLLGAEDAAYLTYASDDARVADFSAVTMKPAAGAAPTALHASIVGGARFGLAGAKLDAGKEVEKRSGPMGPPGVPGPMEAPGAPGYAGAFKSPAPAPSTMPAGAYFARDAVTASTLAMPGAGGSAGAKDRLAFSEASISIDGAAPPMTYDGPVVAPIILSDTVTAADKSLRTDALAPAATKKLADGRSRGVVGHATRRSISPTTPAPPPPASPAPVNVRRNEAEQALQDANAMYQKGFLVNAQLRAQHAYLLASTTPQGGDIVNRASQLLGELSTRMEKVDAVAMPGLGEKYNLVACNQSLEDALHALGTASGLAITIIPGSLADAQEMSNVAALRVTYLDCTGYSTAQTLDALLTPFHLTWRMEKGGISVGTANRLGGVSAWVYTVGDLAIPEKSELGKNPAEVINKSMDGFLHAVRTVIGQKDAGGVKPGSAIWTAPGLLMVYGDQHVHARVAAFLTAMKDGKSPPAAGLSLTTAQQKTLAALQKAASTRWAARADLRKQRLAQLEQQRITNSLASASWNLFASAARGEHVQQAQCELQAAFQSPQIAAVCTANPALALQSAWLISESARQQPKDAALQSLLAMALDVPKTVFLNQLDGLKKLPEQADLYVQILYGLLGCRNAQALAIPIPPEVKDRLAEAQGLLTAEHKTVAYQPLATALLAPTTANDALLCEMMKKHQLGGDVLLTLTTLAARERGGEVWKTFRVEQPALMHVQPVSGLVLVALNRIAATPAHLSAEGGKE